MRAEFARQGTFVSLILRRPLFVLAVNTRTLASQSVGHAREDSSAQKAQRTHVSVKRGTSALWRVMRAQSVWRAIFALCEPRHL